MLTVDSKTITPPDGGWHWKDEFGFPVSDTNWRNFLGKVHRRLVATDSFVGSGWDLSIEDYVCRNTPGIVCRNVGVPERHLNWDDLKQFFAVSARFVESGGELVSQEEANRRAAICSGCRANQPLGGRCPRCTQIFEQFYKLLSGKATPSDPALQNCSVCSCRNAVAVWIPLEIQRDARFTPDSFIAMNSQCWKAEK